MSNYDRFMATYTAELGKAVAARPADYCWPAGATVESVAVKMGKAIIAGSYSKGGSGIRRTCKALGIVHTYKAINAFILES